MNKTEIGYCRDARTGNYIVTFRNPAIPAKKRAHRQQIVVQPAFFRKVTAINSHSIAGVTDVTDAQLLRLGFIWEVVACTGSAS